MILAKFSFSMGAKRFGILEGQEAQNKKTWVDLSGPSPVQFAFFARAKFTT